MYLSSADIEIIEKRYKYFRWVDDIRICATNQKQAIRALHDLQKALGRYRLFLASDKTKIIIKGTPEFDALLDVEDDVLISKIEEATIKASKQEIETIYIISKNKLEHHSEKNGDDRKFRAFANRLLDISEFKEYHDDIISFVTNIVKPRLESHPERSDYWIKMLLESEFNNWKNEVYKLLKEDSSVYNWQRFYLWKLLTNSENTDPKFLELAKSLLHSPVSDLEAYQAIIFIGKHGSNTDREILFTQHFSAQKSYPIQRAILIAIQELEDHMKQIYFNRALDLTKEHTQLIEYLKKLQSPKYGIKKRPTRELKQDPPPIKLVFDTFRFVTSIAGQSRAKSFGHAERRQALVRYVQWLERCLRWILRSWCGEKRSWKQEREEGFRSVVRCGVRYCYALLYRIPHQYYFDDLRLESENWVVSKREFQS
jgi:hypothetical protein